MLQELSKPIGEEYIYDKPLHVRGPHAGVALAGARGARMGGTY